jgi:hypothetical protein
MLGPALQNIKPQERRRLLKDATNDGCCIEKKERNFFFFLIFYFFAFLCFLSAPCSNVAVAAGTTMPDRHSLLLTIMVPCFLTREIE